MSLSPFCQRMNLLYFFYRNLMTPTPTNMKLYNQVKEEIYKKYPKHSAYRSGLLVQEYKKKEEHTKEQNPTLKDLRGGLGRNGKIRGEKKDTETSQMYTGQQKELRRIHQRHFKN